MYLTDPEENFWPWHWTHDGKALNTMDEHIKAFKTLDPYTDQTYNATMHLMCNDDGHKKNRAITDNIICNTVEPDVSEKISVRDYKTYAVEKFDEQMEKLLQLLSSIACHLFHQSCDVAGELMKPPYICTQRSSSQRCIICFSECWSIFSPHTGANPPALYP